jgi:hypothetical protein
VSLKSIEHHNTGIGPEEIEEEPIVMVRAQEQQRRATMRAQKKNGVSIFFSIVSVQRNKRNQKGGAQEQ